MELLIGLIVLIVISLLWEHIHIVIGGIIVFFIWYTIKEKFIGYIVFGIFGIFGIFVCVIISGGVLGNFLGDEVGAIFGGIFGFVISIIFTVGVTGFASDDVGVNRFALGGVLGVAIFGAIAGVTDYKIAFIFGIVIAFIFGFIYNGIGASIVYAAAYSSLATIVGFGGVYVDNSILIAIYSVTFGFIVGGLVAAIEVDDIVDVVSSIKKSVSVLINKTRPFAFIAIRNFIVILFALLATLTYYFLNADNKQNKPPSFKEKKFVDLLSNLVNHKKNFAVREIDYIDKKKINNFKDSLNNFIVFISKNSNEATLLPIFTNEMFKKAQGEHYLLLYHLSSIEKNLNNPMRKNEIYKTAKKINQEKDIEKYFSQLTEKKEELKIETKTAYFFLFSLSLIFLIKFLGFSQLLSQIRFVENFNNFFRKFVVAKGELPKEKSIEKLKELSLDDFSSYSLYGNSKVKQGTLARETTIGSIAYNWISFYENGKVRGGYLARETTIDGIVYRGGISFHENGKVRRGALARETTIDGIVYRGGISFHENGKVKW